VILAIGASLLLPACSGTSQSDIDKAKAAGASEEAARQKQKSLEDEQARIAAELKKLQQESAQARSQAATPGPTVASRAATPAPRAQAPATTSCGDNVSVSSNTSCAFAANVKAAFFDAGGGTSTVDVYSPTTGRFYSMRCVAGVPTVCRGGNNAVVYLR
jgi:biotin carboxyl carrier protein